MVRDTHPTPNLSEGFECSHVVRLSGRQWLVVVVVLLAVVGLGPTVWNHFESFQPGSDYRLPYELSSDYWLWRRHCGQACEQGKILVVGDSVVWGHYVPPEQTLTHYLNVGATVGAKNLSPVRANNYSPLRETDRFANLGLDGTHPAALEGLVRYYGPALCGRTILLHLNPLWLSSAKHDLQTDKEFHFNHSELVSQFVVPIPCYKASFSKRLRIVLRRTIPFSNWVAHLRTTYYGSTDLQTWTLEHPYDCPLARLKRGLPKPGGIPEPSGGTWVERGAKKQDLAWVELDSSLQWRFFRRTLQLLQKQANNVFVLVGPFNEHMLNESDAAAYNTIKNRLDAWFRENKILYFVPDPLPAEYYVDASHPIGEGYALLAKELLKQPTFLHLTGR